MPFRLWPAQLPVLWGLQSGSKPGRNNPDRLTLILKARQLGISWICCMYALWLCLFSAGKVVLLFSKGQTEADELLRRIKVLYERLPEWMRAALPQMRAVESDGELHFANGSVARSLAATKSGGRSFTASLVILDEAAFLLWPDELYSALKPTIDAGGQLVILSTANGIGNLFHRLWIAAAAGQNAFRAVFLPWWCRPGRDAEWYAAQVRDYNDPDLVKQEYPSSATEAFLVSGRTRFNPDWIAAQAPNIGPGLPRDQWPEALRTLDLGRGSLTIYRLPDPERGYSLGADVAEGLEHGDFCIGELLDKESWEQVAELAGHWEPDEFAALLDALAVVYDCDPLIERNNHGHAVLVAFKALESRPALGHDGKRGWLTNDQTKKLMIDHLAAQLRDRTIIIHSQAALNELQIYMILKNGSTGAPSGYHDDRVMALAIALQAALRGNRTFIR